MIRRAFKWLVLLVLVAAVLQSLAGDFTGELPGLLLLAFLGYLWWRAWPNSRSDLDRLPIRVYRSRRGRGTSDEGLL